MKIIKFSLLAIVTIIFVTFCVVNREAVLISLFPLPYSINLPVFLLALLCMALGVIISSIIFHLRLYMANSLLKKTLKRAEAAEDENKILRSKRDYSRPALTNKL